MENHDQMEVGLSPLFVSRALAKQFTLGHADWLASCDVTGLESHGRRAHAVRPGDASMGPKIIWLVRILEISMKGHLAFQLSTKYTTPDSERCAGERERWKNEASTDHEIPIAQTFHLTLFHSIIWMPSLEHVSIRRNRI